jgi:sec-independent protein translocase protein TatA
VVVLLFGAKRLPDSARSLGRSMRIFRSEMHEAKHEATTDGPAPGIDTAIPPATPVAAASHTADVR